MDVIQCESGEGALCELEKMGGRVSMMFTDVNLAGRIDGIELAHFAAQCYPNIHVIATSGQALTKSLPDGVTFIPKPRNSDPPAPMLDHCFGIRTRECSIVFSAFHSQYRYSTWHCRE